MRASHLLECVWVAALLSTPVTALHEQKVPGTFGVEFQCNCEGDEFQKAAAGSFGLCNGCHLNTADLSAQRWEEPDAHCAKRHDLSFSTFKAHMITFPRPQKRWFYLMPLNKSVVKLLWCTLKILVCLRWCSNETTEYVLENKEIKYSKTFCIFHQLRVFCLHHQKASMEVLQNSLLLVCTCGEVDHKLIHCRLIPDMRNPCCLSWVTRSHWHSWRAAHWRHNHYCFYHWGFSMWIHNSWVKV